MVDGRDLQSWIAQREDLGKALLWVHNFVKNNAKAHANFVVREDHVRFLHYTVAQRLVDQPGFYRGRNVRITNSPHTPPRAEEVSGYMQEFIQRLNDIWGESSPVQIAAYSMWRLNWIHPFPNGNGRTSRLFSYFLLNMHVGKLLHGKAGSFLPEVIGEPRGYRRQYIKALQDYDNGNPLTLEGLIAELLRQQLINSY